MLTNKLPTQYIGVGETQDYFNQIATFKNKGAIIFDRSIPKPTDTSLIQLIVSELVKQRDANFLNYDISLCDNQDLNQLICEGLNTIVPFADTHEHFGNGTIKHNFIAKLMIWCSEYIEGTDKQVIFFGEPKHHEFYFLYLLSLVGNDVKIYTPNGSAVFLAEEIAMEVLTLGQLNNITLEQCLAKGIYVEKVTTYAKQATMELEQTLYNGSGVYKPWQFASGTTKPVHLDSIIEDLITYWNEEARMRPGFRTEGRTVYVPTFFTKINGVHKDTNTYFKLVEQLKTARQVLFFESLKIFSEAFVREALQPQQIYGLAYCLNQDLSINQEALQANALYTSFSSLRKDLQIFLCEKITATCTVPQSQFFKNPPAKAELTNLLGIVLNLTEPFFSLLENFDYTEDVPKLVIYENSLKEVDKSSLLLLAFLKQVGFDIIFLTPAGNNIIEPFIQEQFLTQVHLEEFVRNFELKQPKKESFLKRIFR